MIAPACFTCKKPLTDENWVPCEQKRNRKICIYCNRARGKAANKKYKEINSKKTKKEIFNGTLKKCPCCKEELPLTKQYWTSSLNRHNGIDPRCKDCGAIMGGKQKAKKRNHNYDSGTITGKELRILKAKGCYFNTSLCNNELALDHNHVTGKIRGYVCRFHNLRFIPGLEEMATLKSKEEFNRWLQWIFNPPAKQFYS